MIESSHHAGRGGEKQKSRKAEEQKSRRESDREDEVRGFGYRSDFLAFLLSCSSAFPLHTLWY
jgi:hypothetical protein